MKRSCTIFAAMVMAGLTGAAYAQMPTQGPVPFAEHDTDKDGTISKNEFETTHKLRMQMRAEEGRMMRNAGTAPDFDYFDTDRDGKITPKELRDGQTKRMQERPRGMGPR